MLNLVDYFGGTLIIFPLAIAEVVAIFWVYGLENFCLDIEFMSGKPISWYWRICWSVVAPVAMIVIFIYSLISITPLTYSKLNYPEQYIGKDWFSSVKSID